MDARKFSLELKALKIGDKKPGDAICMRWGWNLSKPDRSQFVCVVDAGANESDAEKVINCVKNDFNSETIDLLINTHPHDDHLGGFAHLIDAFDVKKIVLHLPWKYDALMVILKSVKEPGLLSAEALERYHIRNVQKLVYELGQKKKKQVNAPVIESWSGGKSIVANGMVITALGPSDDYYINSFKGIADYKESKITEAQLSTLASMTDAGDTSCIHDCCYIFALAREGCKDVSVLLTGDATVAAQNEAVKYARSKGMSFDKLQVFQVSHHGSERNSRVEMLSKVLKQISKSEKRFAFASAPSLADGHHPSKLVVDAVRDRGWIYLGENDSKDVSLRTDW